MKLQEAVAKALHRELGYEGHITTANLAVAERILADPGVQAALDAEKAETWERCVAYFAEHADVHPNSIGETRLAYPYREAARPEPDDDACSHDWTSRPESDTWVCEICGADR